MRIRAFYAFLGLFLFVIDYSKIDDYDPKTCLFVTSLSEYEIDRFTTPHTRNFNDVSEISLVSALKINDIHIEYIFHLFIRVIPKWLFKEPQQNPTLWHI